MLPISLLLVLPLHYRELNAARIFAVGVGVMPPYFTAVGAAITLRLGVMLAKFSPFV